MQFTIYGWKDHAIWSTAWNEPNLYKWMFSQIRGKPEVGLLWNEPGTSASATQTNTGGKDTSTSGSAVSSSNIDNEDSSAGPAGNKGGNRTGMVLYIILAVAVLGVGVGALAVICTEKACAERRRDIKSVIAKTIERGKGIPLYCFLHIQNRGSEPDVLPLKYGYDIIII